MLIELYRRCGCYSRISQSTQATQHDAVDQDAGPAPPASEGPPATQGTQYDDDFWAQVARLEEEARARARVEAPRN